MAQALRIVARYVTVKAVMSERFLNLVVPLAHKATAMRITGTRRRRPATKTILQPVTRGVDFVGHVIRPWNTRARKRTVNEAISRVSGIDPADLYTSANSYFGLLRQSGDSHHDRARLARAVLRRGHTVNKAFTKTYRRSHGSE